MMPATLAARTRLAWQVTLALVIALLAGLVIDHSCLRPVFRAPVLAIQLVPLLLVLPGLWQQRPRSGIWLCFVLLLYFLLMVEHVAMGRDRLFYLLQTALTVMAFISSMLFARWQVRLA